MSEGQSVGVSRSVVRLNERLEGGLLVFGTNENGALGLNHTLR